MVIVIKHTYILHYKRRRKNTFHSLDILVLFIPKKERKKKSSCHTVKKNRKRQRKDLLTTLNLCTEVTDIYMFYRTSGSGLPAKNDLNSTSDLSGCEKGAS